MDLVTICCTYNYAADVGLKPGNHTTVTEYMAVYSDSLDYHTEAIMVLGYYGYHVVTRSCIQCSRT